MSFTSYDFFYSSSCLAEHYYLPFDLYLSGLKFFIQYTRHRLFEVLFIFFREIIIKYLVFYSFLTESLVHLKISKEPLKLQVLLSQILNSTTYQIGSDLGKNDMKRQKYLK